MYVIYIIMLYQTRMTFLCGTQKKSNRVIEKTIFPQCGNKNGLMQKSNFFLVKMSLKVSIHFPMCSSE